MPTSWTKCAPRSAPRSSICSTARRRPAGGRASCAPTSRWTPRTCCCGSSSASSRRTNSSGRALDPLAAARRRHLGELRGRPGRPVDDHRGLRRAAAGRRRRRRAAPEAGPRVHPRQRRHRSQPGVHPDLAGAVRRVVVGRPAGDAAGADPAAELGAAQRLRLGVLGPADRRADHRRGDAAPGPSAAVRPGRAAHRHPPAGAAHRARSRSAFNVLDRALKVYDRSPVKPGRAHAMRRAAEWIIARQEADGGWGGIQPPWVYSILALHLLGYPLDHPVMVAGDRRASKGSSSAKRPPTARCAGSRPASRRCGTPAWR